MIKTDEHGVFKCIFVDIDGTLVENVPLPPGQLDWIEVHEAAHRRHPVAGVVELVRELHAAGVMVVILTARTDAVRQGTQRWLDDHRIPHHRLLMRRADDTRPNPVVKAAALQHFLMFAGQNARMLFAIDDDPECCQMYRDQFLIPTIQVLHERGK